MIYTIIGVIILILALILLLILFIPFHITFYLRKQEENIRGNFKINWLKIRIIQRDIPSEEDKKKKEKKEKKEKKKRKFDLDQFLKVINQLLNALEHIIPIFRAFLKSIHLEKFSLNLNLGFYSPVDTAMFSGIFWSISAILNVIPPINLSVTPDFQKSKFDGSLELMLKLKLYPIVAAVIKALTKKPVWKLLWSLRKLNQKS